MELVVQSGPDAGKIYQVGRTPLVAGRQPGTDIILNDWQVSRRHVQFELVNGTLVVNDLGSSNGTLVNGQRLAPNQSRPVVPGDLIQVGGTILVARQQGAAPAATPSAFAAGPAPVSNPPATPANPAVDKFGPTNSAQPVMPSPAPAQFYNPPMRPVAPPPGPGYAPPLPPVKKKGNGLLIGGILGIVVLAGLAIGAIFLIGSNKSDNTAETVFNPPTKPAGTTSAPTTPVPTSTPAIGLSGTNILPPQPPAATTTRAVTATRPAATATAASSSNSGKVSGLGLSVTFPSTWKSTVDEEKNAIAGIAPDGVTYTLIQRIAGFGGTPSERLNSYLTSLNQSLSDLKIVRPVKASATNSTVADAYITYTDRDRLLRRDYVLAASSAGDTYFIHFSTDDQQFDKQTQTFTDILKSIQI
jgi:hypothetical protein